jgi:hypothetical protein
MENTLILPNRMKDPFFLKILLALQEGVHGGVRAFDMSQITFIEPYSMVSLLLMGRNHLRGSGERLRLVNIAGHTPVISRMIFSVPEFSMSLFR